MNPHVHVRGGRYDLKFISRYFHCPDDIDIISRYEKKNLNHILVELHN